MRTMENKQTAIDWLVANIDWLVLKNCPWQYEMLIKQAKAMEKEQLGETWDAALGAFDARGFNRVRAIVDFDDYYNETYGKA